MSLRRIAEAESSSKLGIRLAIKASSVPKTNLKTKRIGNHRANSKGEEKASGKKSHRPAGTCTGKPEEEYPSNERYGRVLLLGARLTSIRPRTPGWMSLPLSRHNQTRCGWRRLEKSWAQRFLSHSSTPNERLGSSPDRRNFYRVFTALCQCLASPVCRSLRRAQHSLTGYVLCYFQTATRPCYIEIFCCDSSVCLTGQFVGTSLLLIRKEAVSR
jgi:hypothetical protein